MKYRRVWYAIGATLLVAIVVGSLMPVPRVASAPNDKLIHFLIYFSLMAWFGQLGGKRGWLLAAFAGLGLGLELLQGQTRYRTFEWADVAANTAGVAVAWVAVLTPFGRTVSWLDSQLQRILDKKIDNGIR
jgi:hypothetical protein